MTDPNRQEDFQKLGKKHPYLIYLMIVAGLFLFLVIMAVIALNSGWIPDRGITQ